MTTCSSSLLTAGLCSRKPELATALMSLGGHPDLARVVGASGNPRDGGPVDKRLLAGGEGGERCLKPHHVAAGNEFTHGPVRRPGVVQNRLPGPLASDGLGDKRRVVPLYLLDSAGQTVRLEVVVDDVGASPAGVAADQVGLAVAIKVEQGRQAGVGEVAEVGDAVFRSCRRIGEVALQST